MVQDTRRETILHAAGRVVLAKGVGGLTLNAVADEAGVSKGGLLYHFAGKDALLDGMVQQLIDLTEDRIADAMAEDSGPGCWTRAYLAACAVDPEGGDPFDRLATALIAAGASDPDRLQRLRDHQAHWRDCQRSDGIDPVNAMLVRLAADGLWMNDLFGIDALSPDERSAVVRRLRGMTQP